MAALPSVLEDKRERIAEWLLLIWLKNLDRNILGLRRVDEGNNGRPLPMVHIAIPLEYPRKQLARTLVMSELEDKRKTPRVNLVASARSNKPYSYVRVPARFLVSEVLDAIKERLMRPTAPRAQPVSAAYGSAPYLDRPRPGHNEENRRLRSAVQQGLAIRNVPIEPQQIEILTNRETSEKWVRVVNVDRGRRTALRLAIKRAGINALLALDHDALGLGWSIRFAAIETSKLLHQSAGSFDVHSDSQILVEDSGDDEDSAPSLKTAPTVRLFSPASLDEAPIAPENRKVITMQLESTRSRGADAIGTSIVPTFTAGDSRPETPSSCVRTRAAAGGAARDAPNSLETTRRPNGPNDGFHSTSANGYSPIRR
jgi:hypothetical protein